MEMTYSRIDKRIDSVMFLLFLLWELFFRGFVKQVTKVLVQLLDYWFEDTFAVILIEGDIWELDYFSWKGNRWRFFIHYFRPSLTNLLPNFHALRDSPDIYQDKPQTYEIRAI